MNIFFLRKNDFIYRKKSFQNAFFIFRRLCISTSCIKDILAIVYNKDNYSGFDKTYQRTISSYYIKKFSDHLKRYLKHFVKCFVNQIKRHKYYNKLQSIMSFFISFHIIIMNFIFVMFFAYIDINNVIIVTCKFSKRITMKFEKSTWSTLQ